MPIGHSSRGVTIHLYVMRVTFKLDKDLYICFKCEANQMQKCMEKTMNKVNLTNEKELRSTQLGILWIETLSKDT